MRWTALVRVRNEEDILEASIRHNLGVVDRIVVVDQGSDDATPAILDALVGEGLPIAVERDDRLEAAPAADDDRRVAKLLDDGADFALALAADAFLRIPSRAALEALAGDRAMRLPHAVARLPAGGDLVARLRSAQRLVDDRPARRTTVHRAGAPAMPAVDVDASAALVVRVPVRSAAQATACAAVGYLAALLADEQAATRGPHAAAYAAILAGKAFDDEALLDLLVNDGRPAGERVDPATAAFADEPLATAVALRHTPSTPPRPLARVLGFGERVAEEIARTTGGL